MKLRNELSKLKDIKSINSIFYLLPLIFLLGKNNIVDFVLLIYSLIFCLKITINNLFVSFIFMSFFEEMTIIPLIGGSISRIIMLILLVRIIMYLFKHKYNIGRRCIYVSFFFFLSCFAGVLYNGLDFGEISVFINVITILLYGEYFRHRKFTFSEYEIEFKKVIVYAVLIAIIHGFLNASFITEVTANLTSLRFKGTYEPNFMSLFINIGITILLFDAKQIFEFKEKMLLLLFFFTALCMTVSMTGFLGLGFIATYFIIYNYWNDIKLFLLKWRKHFIILLSIIFIFLGVFIVQLESQTKNENGGSVNIQEQTTSRFLFMYETLKKGDLNTFTSGRLSIMQDFYSASINRPLHEVLIGNGPSSKTVYSNFFKKVKYAHNSYIDIFYSFGFLGGLACIIYVINVIKNKVFLNYSLSKNNAFYVIRFLILIYALTLSLYSKRLILLMFLL